MIIIIIVITTISVVMIIINDKDKNENIKFRPMFDYYFLSTCRPTVAYF